MPHVTLPCITLGEGDDAEALEISMIENMLRQNPDQVTQQNAALVERTACAACDMRELARQLSDEVARYRMPADAA